MYVLPITSVETLSSSFRTAHSLRHYRPVFAQLTLSHILEAVVILMPLASAVVSAGLQTLFAQEEKLEKVIKAKKLGASSLT